MSKKGQPQDNQYGSALQHIVIDKRLASIMKVSPTSSSFNNESFYCRNRRVLSAFAAFPCVIWRLLIRSYPWGGSRMLSLVKVGKKPRISGTEFFSAVNNKDYDKAFTYVIDQAKVANPTEKQSGLSQ